MSIETQDCPTADSLFLTWVAWSPSAVNLLGTNPDNCHSIIFFMFIGFFVSLEQIVKMVSVTHTTLILWTTSGCIRIFFPSFPTSYYKSSLPGNSNQTRTSQLSYYCRTWVDYAVSTTAAQLLLYGGRQPPPSWLHTSLLGPLSSAPPWSFIFLSSLKVSDHFSDLLLRLMPSNKTLLVLHKLQSE